MAEALSDGQVRENALRDGGFSQQEIDQWKSETAQHLQDGGFSDQEVRDYFGQKTPDTTAMKTVATNNIKAALQGPQDQKEKPKREPIDASPKPVAAEDIWDAMAAGWGNSILGLATRGEKSPIAVDENASAAQAAASGVAQLVGDAPAMAAGDVVGSLPGAFAVPAALRKIMIDHYEKGDIQDASDFAQRLVSTTWEAAKGAATGAVTGAVGSNLRFLNTFGEGAVTKALTGTASRLAAEVTAQTTVSKALEGQLPNKNDFINGAVLMGGLHGVGVVAPKMMNMFARTGAMPHEAEEILNQDPVMKTEMLSDATHLPKDAAPIEEAPPSVAAEKPPETGAAPEEPTVDQAAKEIRSRIAEPEEETKKNLIERALSGAIDLWSDTKTDSRNAYVNYFDKTARLKDLIEKIGPEKLDEETSYTLARAFAAENDVVGHFFNHGTLDPITNDINGESLRSIYDDYRTMYKDDPQLQRVENFMIAKRSLELEGRGIKQPGVRENDRIYTEAHPELEDIAKRIVKFLNNVLNYARGKGLLSEEQQKTFIDKNQWFIPFFKAVDAENAGGSKRLQSFKAIGDSMLQLQSPLENMRRNTEMLIKEADENEIKRQAHKDMLSAENPEEFMKDISPKAINLSGDRVAEALKKQGLDLNDQEVKNFTLFTKSDIPKGDDIFAYRDNGKLVVVKTVDPGIAEVLNSFSNNYQGMSVFTKAFKLAAQSVRFGTIQNPLTGFFLRHTFRNQEQAAVFSQTGLLPFEALKYLPEKGGEMWNQAMRDGALVNGFEKVPQAYFTDTMQGFDKKIPFTQQVYNNLSKGLNFTHALIMNNDNIIRYAEYKRTLEQGGSRTEATMNARDILADFQKEGLRRSALQSMKAFFKAHYQGQFQMGGVLKDLASDNIEARNRALGIMARNVGYITVPSIILGMVNAGDQRIQEMPGWLRDGYWTFHIPNWREASLPEAMSRKQAYPGEVREGSDGKFMINDGYVYKMPKPFANGMFFGSVIEESMNAWQKKEPKEFAKFFGRIADSMFLNPLPTAAQPFMEQALNRNLFKSQPLIRNDMARNRLPEDLYEPYTSEFSKMLGRAIGHVPVLRDIGPKDAPLASPIVIDNYIKTFTGGSGKYLLQAADILIGKSDTPPPKWQWSDIPFVQEWLVRHDLRPEVVDEFQEKQDIANQVAGSIKFRMKQGDFAGAVQLQNDWAREQDRLSNYQEGIKNMQIMIHKVQGMKASEASPIQKRQLIDTLTYQIIGASREGLNVMKKFEGKK